MQSLAIQTIAPSVSPPTAAPSGGPPGGFARALAGVDDGDPDQNSPSTTRSTDRQGLAATGNGLPPTADEPQPDAAPSSAAPIVDDSALLTAPATASATQIVALLPTAPASSATGDAKPAAPRAPDPRAVAATPAAVGQAPVDAVGTNRPDGDKDDGKEKAEDRTGTATDQPAAIDATLALVTVAPPPLPVPAPRPTQPAATSAATPAATAVVAAASPPIGGPVSRAPRAAATAPTTGTGEDHPAADRPTAPNAAPAPTIVALAALLRTRTAPADDAAPVAAGPTSDPAPAAAPQPKPLPGGDTQVVGVVQPAARAFAQAIAQAEPQSPAAPRRSARDADRTGTIDASAGGTVLAPAATAAARSIDPPAVIDTRHAKWIDGIIDHIEVLRDAADAGDARIRLVPDALGKIDIALRREGDTVNVRFTAEQPQTRQLLADAQPRLAEIANVRGLRIGESSIDGGNTATDAGSRQRPGAGQGDAQQRFADASRQPIANRQVLSSTADEPDDAVSERGWLA